MAAELSDEQREQAEAAANLVASVMTRLRREHGAAAVMEAMRLISTAFPSEERRQEIAKALGANPGASS